MTIDFSSTIISNSGCVVLNKNKTILSSSFYLCSCNFLLYSSIWIYLYEQTETKTNLIYLEVNANQAQVHFKKQLNKNKQ